MPIDHTAIMNAYLFSLMSTYHIPVVGYAIVNNNAIIAADTISINSTIHPTINSMFQAASISKPVAAFAALMLVAKNRIQLDNSVNLQLLSWKIPKDNAGYSEIITPRECLNMTSGLSYGKPGTKFEGYPQGNPIPTLDELLNGKVPATNPAIQAYYAPKQCYSYTGAGYMVMQKLMEDVTEKPFNRWMQETIFPKIGMQHSIYACPLSLSQQQQAIPGFDKNQHMIKDGWDNIPAPTAGGLWSTPSDIAHFMIELSLSKNISSTMLAQQKNSPFGLGVSLNNKGRSFNFRKIGSNTGYYNLLMMFPNTGQGIIIMTNSANGLELIKAFLTYVAKQQNWPKYSNNFDETTLNTCLATHALSQNKLS